MIAVYYAKVFPPLEEDAFLLYLEKVEKERRKKLLHGTKQGSSSCMLAAGCLLHKALCEWMGLEADDTPPFKISYGKEGKPYLKEKPELYFNLSHSGEYVCCAAGDVPVGVDLQKKTAVKEKIAERFFTAADNQRLSLCRKEEWNDLFFRMWSIKESFVKLTGEGLKQGLGSFEINWQLSAILEEGKDKPSAYFKEQTALPEYSFCVCTKEPQENVAWKETLL